MFVNRVVGDNTHEFGLYLGAVPLLLAVWAHCPETRVGPAGRFGLGRLGLRRADADSRLWALWHPVLATRLAATVANDSFPLPLRRAVPVCRRCAGRDRVLAVDGRKPPGPTATPPGRDQWDRLATCPTGAARPARLWRNFEPLWCVVGASAVVAGIGVACRHDPYVASLPAILAGPLLALAATALVIAAARGAPAALVGLIVLAAVDQGCLRPRPARSIPQAQHARGVCGIRLHPARQTRRTLHRFIVPFRSAGSADGRLDDLVRLATGRRLRRPRTGPATRLSPPARPPRGGRSVGKTRSVHVWYRRSQAIR